MLEIKVNKGNVESEIHGCIAEICADVFTVVHVVYEQLLKSDEELGQIFKDSMLAFLDTAFSLDNEEVIKEMKKRTAKKHKQQSKKEKMIEIFNDCLEMAENDCSVKDIIDYLDERIEGEEE